jgi:hypothetical protein
MAKTSGGLRAGISTMTPVQASEHIRSILADIANDGFSKARPFTVGEVESELREYAREHGIDLAGKDIVMNVKQITHTLRDSKVDKGIAVSPEHLAQFPLRRLGMELYHDSTNNNFIYYDRTRNEKFVIHPNYEMKIGRAKGKVVNYITASKTNPQEFTLTKLRRIK